MLLFYFVCLLVSTRVFLLPAHLSVDSVQNSPGPQKQTSHVKIGSETVCGLNWERGKKKINLYSSYFLVQMFPFTCLCCQLTKKRKQRIRKCLQLSLSFVFNFLILYNIGVITCFHLMTF